MEYPIYPGMDVKFQVTTEWEDFNLSDDSFTIEIRDHHGRTKQKMRRDDLFWDSDGRFYFTVENVKNGLYYALFKGSYEDEDYDDQRAHVTDIQELLRVPCCARDNGCKNTILKKRCCMHKIHYQIVCAVSIDGDEYLCGSDGKYILTSDGKRICFKSDKAKEIEEDMGKVRLETMDSKEFKRFIEGRNPDGDIDTVPEMMDAMQGISDDETVRQDVNEQIDDKLQQNMGTHADIDEIFNQ